ncbi:MAG: penicillin-binding protein [Hyphomicrobiales bacterium]|nr:MAG: penicillin-binding protein [Hyphomicrobiales bacterium]
MARRSRRQERVEPRLDDDSARDGSLDLRLSEADRASSHGTRRKRGRKSTSSAPAADTTARSAPKKRAKRRGSSSSGGGGFFGRLFKRTVYWGLVAGLWGGIAFVGMLAYYAAHLPPTSEWAVPKRPPNVKIVDANGKLVANRGDTGGESVRLEQLPPHMMQAVMAIEDRRFYYHFGIDPIGLGRAMAVNLAKGRLTQGGSTLTQQLAKNLFLEPERTFRRKMQEVVLSLWLEAKFSKEEILEMYLNRVYFGAGAYGVDAAARRYFGKSARQVTVAEAAVLAGLLKAPSRYSPTRNPDLADARAQTVLAAMQDAGYLSAKQVKQARAAPATVTSRHNSASENYVADWVMDQLPSYVGSLDEDIIVDTSVDSTLQNSAEKVLRNALSEKGGKLNVGQGAIVVLDAGGAVKALVGGRDYGQSQFNRAVSAHRQPGSAFKPFVYLAALERGMTPETVRQDAPITIKGWSPKNYTKKHYGNVTLAKALSMSLNTVAARLAYEVGPKRVVSTAHRLGVASKLNATPSIALGTSEVTPLEITAAYVPFSNGGYGVMPYVIRRIHTAGGKVLYERAGSGIGKIVAAEHIGMMNAMMRRTLESGTGKKASLGEMPAGGKTGTSQDFRDAWFIGYTAYYTAGVWLGNDDNSPTKRATGGSLPAEIWAEVMKEANRDLAIADLPGNYRLDDSDAMTAEVGDVPTGTVPTPQRSPQNARSEHVMPRPNERGLLQRLFGG